MQPANPMHRAIDALTRTGDRWLNRSRWRLPTVVTQVPGAMTGATDPLLTLNQQLTPLTGSQGIPAQGVPSTARPALLPPSPTPLGEGIGHYRPQQSAVLKAETDAMNGTPLAVEAPKSVISPTMQHPAVQQVLKTMASLNLPIAVAAPVSEFPQRLPSPPRSPEVSRVARQSQASPPAVPPTAPDDSTNRPVPKPKTVELPSKGLRLNQTATGLAALLQAHVATPKTAAAPNTAAPEANGSGTTASVDAEQETIAPLPRVLPQKAPRTEASIQRTFPTARTPTETEERSAIAHDFATGLNEADERFPPNAWHPDEFSQPATPPEIPETLDLDSVVTALADQLTFEFLRTYGSPPGESP